MSMVRRRGRRQFLEQSETDAAITRQRLEVVARLAATPNRTRAEVSRDARQLGLSTVTLYKLLRRYQEDPKPEAMLPRRRGWSKGRPRLGAEAATIIDAAINDFYLTPQKPKLAKLVREVNGRLRRAGLTEVATRTVQRRVAALPADVVVARREGAKAAHDHYGALTCRFEAEHPLDVVQIDHTLADVILLDDLHRQPIGRPWLTVAIDVRTRMIVGFHASLRPPSECSVAYGGERAEC